LTSHSTKAKIGSFKANNQKPNEKHETSNCSEYPRGWLFCRFWEQVVKVFQDGSRGEVCQNQGNEVEFHSVKVIQSGA
jgi:hypothetical protein